MFTQIDSCRVALVHAARARRGCLLAVAHLDPWLAVLNLPSQVSCSALVCRVFVEAGPVSESGFSESVS